MVDDDGLEYAVPHYRDPEKTARIVAARRRGERVKDIAAREGVSHQRVSRICRDAGLTARISTTPPPKACAECGKLLRNPCGGLLLQEMRSRRRCTRNSASERASTRLRRDGAATWAEIANALGWRPDLPQPARRAQAAATARRYAEAHGLPWPLPDRAKAERLARRAEKAAAEIGEVVEEESRIQALLRVAAGGQDDNRVRGRVVPGGAVSRRAAVQPASRRGRIAPRPTWRRWCAAGRRS